MKGIIKLYCENSKKKNIEYIPHNYELVRLFNRCENICEKAITNKIYKIYGIILEKHNNDTGLNRIIEIEKYKHNDNYIYEYITFFNNESPLLIFYDLHNIRYEEINDTKNMSDINNKYLVNESLYENLNFFKLNYKLNYLYDLINDFNNINIVNKKISNKNKKKK